MRRRGEQPKRLPREGARHLRRHAHAAHPQVALRQLLPGRRDRALPARGPCPRCRRGRDVRHRHQRPQGAARRREDGRVRALKGPGERHRLEPGRRRRGAVREAPRLLACALRLARRHLREVPPRGPRGVHRRCRRHRLRCGRLEARPGRRRGGHRVIRLAAGLPQEDPRPRRWRRRARRPGRPPGPRPRPRRGLPGRRVAAPRRPPDAGLHARGRHLAAQAPRGRDRLAGVPRPRRRHRGGNVPRGVRNAGGVPPEGGGGAGGGRAGRAGLPRLPAVALEAPAHRQRAGADEQGDKAQVARGAGVPVNGLARAARRRGHVRAGRDMAGVQALLGGEDERALRRGARARDRREGRLGAARGRGQGDARARPRACGQGRGGIGYQTYSRFPGAGQTRFGSGATPTFPTPPSLPKQSGLARQRYYLARPRPNVNPTSQTSPVRNNTSYCARNIQIPNCFQSSQDERSARIEHLYTTHSDGPK